MSDDEMVLLSRRHLQTLIEFADRGAEDLGYAASYPDNGYDADEVEQQLASLGEAKTAAVAYDPTAYFVFVQYEDCEPDRLYRPTLDMALDIAKAIVARDLEDEDMPGNVTRITINDELFYQPEAGQ